MYIKNKEVADFFGIKKFEKNEHLEAFGQKLELTTNDQENIILLGQERSLYNYKLTNIAELYAKIGERVLIVLCQGLSDARGNGQRKWINMQDGISNFNVNIFTTIPQFDSLDSIWILQEQISTAIIDALSNLNNGGNIEIAYPFHYLLDERKVAGHLIQAVSIDKFQLFVRIGIGINTSVNSPKLLENDELAKNIFKQTNSIRSNPHSWISIANGLSENITTSVEGTMKHEEYIQYLNIKPGDVVTIYEDDGSAIFSEKRAQGKFITIDTAGAIILDTTTLPSGRSFHIVKN